MLAVGMAGWAVVEAIIIHKKLVEANLAYLQLPKDVGGRGLSAYAVTAARDAFEDEVRAYASAELLEAAKQLLLQRGEVGGRC